MTTMIYCPYVERDLIAFRRSRGIDHYDEVWDGVYVITPPRDNEHQAILTELMSRLFFAFQRNGLGRVQMGLNISDQAESWETNYRVLDAAIILQDSAAQNRSSHWFGGPDLGIEVVSENDRTWDKVPFYAAVRMRELLILDRDPWRLTLLRLHNGELGEVGCSTPADARWLESRVVSFSWRLVNMDSSPALEVRDRESGENWFVQSEPCPQREITSWHSENRP